jgi:hypothetical protein
MSLFKERSANSKKIISLQNTIIALKKEILHLQAGTPPHSKTSSVSKEEVDLLKDQLAAANLRVTELEDSISQSKKRSYKKRAQKKDQKDETQA